MKVFKEIERRVRNMARALVGEEFREPDVSMPFKFTASQPMRVDTFVIEKQHLGPFGRGVTFEDARPYFLRNMAIELGQALLESGHLIIEEYLEETGKHNLKLIVRVVAPKEDSNADK